MDIAVITSISEFNFGCLNSLNTEQEQNTSSISIAERRDKRRIKQSEKRNSCDWKHTRKSKKISKSIKTKQAVKEEGQTYGGDNFNVFIIDIVQICEKIKIWYK